MGWEEWPGIAREGRASLRHGHRVLQSRHGEDSPAPVLFSPVPGHCLSQRQHLRAASSPQLFPSCPTIAWPAQQTISSTSGPVKTLGVERREEGEWIPSPRNQQMNRMNENEWMDQ